MSKYPSIKWDFDGEKSFYLPGLNQSKNWNLKTIRTIEYKYRLCPYYNLCSELETEHVNKKVKSHEFYCASILGTVVSK